jgi:hypothetical protein
MRPLAPNVVDNADRNPLGTPILSGGLGGAVLSKRSNNSIKSGARKLTFMQALQQDVAGSGIDLSNVTVQPFDRSPDRYPGPTIKNPHELVQEIEDSIIDRVIARQNSTPCDGVSLSGGLKFVLFKAIKALIKSAVSGERYIIGISIDPAGDSAGRPAGSPLVSNRPV